ncbi:RHS repeat-associated core domain-containing protein, partial [Vibrio penaeicida]
MNKWNSLTITVYVALLFLPLTAYANQTSPVLSGDLNVSQGRLSYSIPISVPVGRAGFQPTVSLNYRDSGGDGNLGIGWSVSGASSITRCGKNLRIDGVRGRINFDENDRFCLDGQRLVAVDGEYGKDKTEYKLRINGFSKIVSYGTQGSGPRYFKIWYKNGEVREYGNTASSKATINNGADVYKWAVNKRTDKSRNNHIEYEYFTDNQHRIKNITYKGGSIQFNYETRPDIKYHYFYGELIKKSDRLQSIETKVLTDNVSNKYEITYETHGVSDQSYVQEVRHCAFNELGVEICAQPVSFDWEISNFPTYGSVTDSGYISPRFFDSDRDGVQEIYGVKQVNGQTMNVSGYGATHYNVNTFTLGGTMDSPSIVTGTCSNHSASFYTDASTGNLVNYCAGSGTNKTKAVDLNGDGSKELVTDDWSYADINGDGKADKYKFSSSTKSYEISGGPTGSLAGTSGLTFLSMRDLNGDGYLDAVFKEPAGSSYNLVVFLFNGQNFTAGLRSEHESSHYSDTSNLPKLAADNLSLTNINKDRNIEIVSGRDVYSVSRFIPEYNKFTIQKIGTVDNGLSYIRDLNGDGWGDQVIKPSSGNVQLKYSGLSESNKITSIIEYEKEYQVEFSRNTNLRIAEKFDWPVVDYRPSQSIVTAVVTKRKGYPNADISENYTYENPLRHMSGHGFLGFEKITRSRGIGDNRTEVVTSYYQEDPPSLLLSRKPKNVQVFKLEPYETNRLKRKVSETTYTYESTTSLSADSVSYSRVFVKESNKKEYSIQKDLSQVIAKNPVIARPNPFFRYEALYYYFPEDREKSSKTTTFSYDNFGRIQNKTETLTSSNFPDQSIVTTLSNTYLSSGYYKNVVSYQSSESLASSNPQLDTKLKSYPNGFSAKCAANGDVYFKPNSKFVLIHSDIDIPLIIEQYDDYYKYTKNDATNSTDGLVRVLGAISEISSSDYAQASATSCASLQYTDFNENGQFALVTETTTRSRYQTEVGENYWKIGAPKTSISQTTKVNGEKATSSETFSYNSKGYLTSSVSTPSFDGAVGEAKTFTQRYGYDSYGNVISETEEGTGVSARTTKTVYDSNGLFPNYTLNAKNHKTDFTYGPLGRVTEVSNHSGSRRTRYGYDGFGRVVYEQSPGLNNTATTQYVFAPNSLCGSSPRSETVSCSIRTSRAGEYQVSQFDYAGRTLRASHKSFDGRMVHVDSFWDNLGRKIAGTKPYFEGQTNPPQVTFKYDVLDRGIQRSEPDANGNRALFKTEYHPYSVVTTDAKNIERTTKYGLDGGIVEKNEPLNATQIYQYYANGKLKSTSAISAGKAPITTELHYDNLGYKQKMSDPDMGTWTYNYNALGELTYQKDANAIVTQYQYDALGRKVKEWSTTGNQVQTSSWSYDARVKGQIDYFENEGSRTEFYYSSSELLAEKVQIVDGEQFFTRYQYDQFERLMGETRPNGEVATTILPSEETLKLEYVYNELGYLAAVRSPKTNADDVFTSEKFLTDVKKLLDLAIAQADKYLSKAERYANQTRFYETKAQEYRAKTINVHSLDTESLRLVGNNKRFKQWCDSNGVCYLIPATWVILHDDVAIPLDVKLDGLFRLNSEHVNSIPGERQYNAQLLAVSGIDVNSAEFTQQHDFVLKDMNGDGIDELISRDSIYLKADSTTQAELYYTADDLQYAADTANTQYKHYTKLADRLLNLVDKVAELSGVYCLRANDLAGGLNDRTSGTRSSCGNKGGVSQADHLNTILTNAELAATGSDSAYVYYWQRRDTDAYDHTLSETLGNGLVNTYLHDANTGRSKWIATHKGFDVYDDSAYGGTRSVGRNIRQLEYHYDKHNNVTYRRDSELGITDRYSYDELDRVISNRIALDSPIRHIAGNPDLQPLYEYRYDSTGNLITKSDSGSGKYQYNSSKAHAVTEANGLLFEYDAVGNMVNARQAKETSPNVFERKIDWNAFNKLTSITRNGATVQFRYDANHSRFLKVSGTQTTVYVDKSYERVTDSADNSVQFNHFIYADGKLVALNTQKVDGEGKLKEKDTRYLHYDALNSVDMITDGYGRVVERRSYSVWGKQRSVIWREDSIVQLPITNRGYTGHEEITEIGLVHMNGRVYDESLGRFLSADPYIQAPFLTNSFNRYSYVNNNPLKYQDPTGYWWWDDDDDDDDNSDNNVEQTDSVFVDETIVEHDVINDTTHTVTIPVWNDSDDSNHSNTWVQDNDNDNDNDTSPTPT